MRTNLDLNLLYNFVEERDSDQNIVSYYKLLYFFSNAGPVSKTTLDTLYQNFPQEKRGNGYTFKTLDELGEFAIAVCVETSAPEIFILSAQDYNIGLDSSNDIAAFKNLFRRYGTCLENPQGGQRRKNLLNKIFS